MARPATSMTPMRTASARAPPAPGSSTNRARRTTARTTGRTGPIVPRTSKVISGSSCSACETPANVRPDLTKTFAALSDPTRMAVVGLLRKEGTIIRFTLGPMLYYCLAAGTLAFLFSRW